MEVYLFHVPENVSKSSNRVLSIPLLAIKMYALSRLLTSVGEERVEPRREKTRFLHMRK